MNRDQLVSLIEAAAERHNVPPDALLAIANLESSGNVNADNPRSSASGLFQFVDSTAREYGLTGSKRNDPEAQADAAAKMMATNSRSLTRVLGREPDAGELYLAHQQGLGGATALIRGGDGLAVDALTTVYRSRSKAEAAIRLNGGSLDMSASAFAGQWIGRANREVGTIPSGKIPNTVASEIDVAPRRPVTLPTPVSQRPAQYEYTRAGRPIDPDNKFLMDESDPRYREAIAGSPVESVRQSASSVQVPLPRPRPVTPRDVANVPYDQGVNIPLDQPTDKRLPDLLPTTMSFAGQDRGPVSIAGRKSVPLSIGAQSSFAGQDAAKFVAGPASVQKDQSRLTTPAALPAPTAGLNKQQVEAATGFRLGNGSVLTSSVEVENPAYASLMKRVQQGEIELRGIAGGMALSRDGRARYDASMKALEAQRQQLANTSRTISVQRQQRAPVAVPVQPVQPKAPAGFNPANHSAAQMEAVAAGRSFFTGDDGGIQPTHAMNGKLRYTY